MIFEVIINGKKSHIVASQEFVETHYPGAWEEVVVEQLPITPTTYVASCSPFQGLTALAHLKGVTDKQITNLLGEISDGMERYTAQKAFERSTEWTRDSRTVQLLAQLLQLSEEDLDQLFAYAAEVQA